MMVRASATQPALRQVTDRVYWSVPDPRTDRPVMGAVSGERGTLIVDAFLAGVSKSVSGGD